MVIKNLRLVFYDCRERVLPWPCHSSPALPGTDSDPTAPSNTRSLRPYLTLTLQTSRSRYPVSCLMPKHPHPLLTKTENVVHPSPQPASLDYIKSTSFSCMFYYTGLQFNLRIKNNIFPKCPRVVFRCPTKTKYLSTPVNPMLTHPHLSCVASLVVIQSNTTESQKVRHTQN